MFRHPRGVESPPIVLNREGSYLWKSIFFFFFFFSFFPLCSTVVTYIVGTHPVFGIERTMFFSCARYILNLAVKIYFEFSVVDNELTNI